MKIISKYVLREHVGPLTFALTALTSLMLLNFISRQFGELVGKGLPWSVIGEFFLLSIPFTVALTVPMSVLVAVLYAYSRLAAENEVTALKASGVSPWRMVYPAIIAGGFWSVGLLAFNDQVLPRANHRLKVLQEDISQAKPTFLLKEQVINPFADGKFYLKAGKIDHEGGSGKMKEVVIYDLSNPTRRRTIYADSGRISMAANHTDIDLDLFHGQMYELSPEKPTELDRLFYEHDRIRIRDVTRDFKKSESETSSKGDREMSVCEMQNRLRLAEGGYRSAQREYEQARARKGSVDYTAPPNMRTWPEPHGIGWVYCSLLRNVFKVREARAAALPRLHAWGDTVPARDSAARRDTVLRKPAAGPAPAPAPAAGAHFAPLPPPNAALADARLAEAKLRLDMATRGRNRYDIEIHKKFSLAAACLIFVIVGAPLAVRFPRGGVGLVLGVSLFVFALYYVGLIGGETLANEGIVPPFWAMWGTNVILTLVGVVMLARMGRDQNTGRGGVWGDRLERLVARIRGRRVPEPGEGA